MLAGGFWERPTTRTPPVPPGQVSASAVAGSSSLMLLKAGVHLKRSWKFSGLFRLIAIILSL